MRGRNGQDRSLHTGKRKIRKGTVDVDIAQQDPRAIPHNSIAIFNNTAESTLTFEKK